MSEKRDWFADVEDVDVVDDDFSTKNLLAFAFLLPFIYIAEKLRLYKC